MIQIVNDYIPYSKDKRPNIKMTPRYIVIHSTGNDNSYARGERGWLANPTNKRIASWHLCIDENICICAIPLNEVAWHCGSNHNFDSIGIEICHTGNRQKVIARAIELTKQLMKQYNIPVENVIRHYDCTKKLCPSILSANNWKAWSEFKSQLSSSKELGQRSNKDTCYTKAIDKLVEKGIISIPILWKNDKFTQDNVHSLIIKIANKL